MLKYCSKLAVLKISDVKTIGSRIGNYSERSPKR